MSSIVVVYHSGYGHTRRQAEAVAAGAGAGAQLVAISPEGEVDAAGWAALDAAGAIVFGTPTYMGGPSWQFKKFADATSKAWFTRAWQDKLFGGFTNSASLNGDKQNTLHYLMTLAMQHGGLWVGLGLMPANSKAAQRTDVNVLGGSIGALMQSPSDSSPEEVPAGDLETARQYGARVAAALGRLKA